MWIFLSRRIRLWLLLAVAVPAARFVLRRLAATTERRYPDTAVSAWLRRADATLSSASRRSRRR